MNLPGEILYSISYQALPLMFAIVLHEYAHGWVADTHGDSTARLQGRLTLNPLAHIDPFGTVILPLLCLFLMNGFLIGWAKPVPINPTQLRNPRRDMALVAAAGPVMNLLLAIGSALLLLALFSLDPSLADSWAPRPGGQPRRDSLGMLLLPIAAMALYSVRINVVLMVFNLIPIPPLDGGRLLVSAVPRNWSASLARVEPYGMLIVVGLIAFDPQIHVLQTIVGGFTDFLARTLLAPVFATSNA